MATSDQLKILFALFVAYFIHVMMRKSLSGVSVFILNENWIDATKLGLILSGQTCGSIVGRSVSMMIIDNINPVILVVFVTILNSIFVTLLTFSTSEYILIIIWGTSGAILGFAWPCLAKIMKLTVEQTEFATWWAVVGAASNVAGMIGPLVHNWLCTNFHWTWSLRAVALMGIIYGIFLSIYLKDWFLEAESNNSNHISETVEEDEVLTDSPGHSLASAMFKPIVLCNSVLAFFVSMSRYTINDWLPIYMTKGMEMHKMRAYGFISAMEMGGLIGSLLWGILSDYLFTYIPRSPRVPVLVLSSMISGFAMLIIAFFLSPHWNDFLLSSLAFIFGVSIFGPVALCGVLALESVPDSIAGSVSAFTSLAGNAGTLLANLVPSVAAQVGWPLVYSSEGFMLLASSALILLCVLVQRGERTHVD